MKRIHCYTGSDGQTESGLSLTEVKKRMKRFGGCGCTQHFDRDGSFQESTPIVLGNNARTTYQAEYNHSRKADASHSGTTSTDSSVDVTVLIKEVYEQAKAENLGESDNVRLMQLLGSRLGKDAWRIAYTWYDRALCHIHGLLFHEYRGMNRSCNRRDAILGWKETKRKEYEKCNKL